MGNKESGDLLFQTPILDKLNMTNSSDVHMLLQENEYVILSTPIYKYNEKRKKQIRNLVITN